MRELVEFFSGDQFRKGCFHNIAQLPLRIHEEVARIQGRNQAKEPEGWAANEQLARTMCATVNTVQQGDMMACMRVERGLGGRLFKPTALSKQEEGLVRFHRLLTERMTRAEG